MRVKFVCVCTLLFSLIVTTHVAAQEPNADGGPADGGVADAGGNVPPLGPPTTPLPVLPPATALRDAGGPVPADERENGCACVALRDRAIDASAFGVWAVVFAALWRRRRSKSRSKSG
jgi:uncharacterized protein (TIGR03382 family)